MQESDRTVEAVILTGGASHRMGIDKATLEVEGVSLARRVLNQFLRLGWETTVLGTAPFAGCKFQKDKEALAGPLASLRQFQPTANWVFVASCDLVLFDHRIAQVFADQIADYDALIPQIDGLAQPLCGLYSARTFGVLRAHTDLVRVRDWTGLLNVREVLEAEQRDWGIHPLWAKGANTPAEIQLLLSSGA